MLECPKIGQKKFLFNSNNVVTQSLTNLPKPVSHYLLSLRELIHHKFVYNNIINIIFFFFLIILPIFLLFFLSHFLSPPLFPFPFLSPPSSLSLPLPSPPPDSQSQDMKVLCQSKIMTTMSLLQRIFVKKL